MQKAISKETGKWIYGTYFDGFMLRGEVVEATEEYITIEEWHEVDKDTLCNCLYIKDIEGRMIYEHDVIQTNFKVADEYIFTVRKISESKGYGAYRSRRLGYPFLLSFIARKGKVIGNEKGYLERFKEGE